MSKQIEPAESLTDNIVGDVMDSLITGIAAQLIVSYVFGKNPSIKNIISTNNLKDGAKVGLGIAAYRRVGRQGLNMVMNRSGLQDMIKL